MKNWCTNEKLMYKYFRDHFVPLYYTTRIRPLGDNYKLWPHRSHLARDIIGRHPQERGIGCGGQ